MSEVAQFSVSLDIVFFPVIIQKEIDKVGKMEHRSRLCAKW